LIKEANEMSVSWKKDYEPIPVLKKIESARKVRSDGKVIFEGWEFREYVTVVHSMLDFPENMPEETSRSAVSKAIFTAGEKGEITTKSLLAEVNKLEHKYQSQPTEKYVLATSISIDSSLKLKRIRVGNTTITFEKQLPAKFRTEIEKVAKDVENQLFASAPTDYLYVRIYTSARSIPQAANQALDTLDFVRGIWNWTLNMRHSIRSTLGGKPKPINEIILGPFHTLHKPDGALIGDMWWWEPSYLGAITPFSFKKEELEKVDESFKYVRKIFKTHNYPQLIQNAFIRYARALDERVWTTAFLKLWSILELLTATNTSRANYDTTKERVAFLYAERDYHMQALQHLREYRNSAVHFDKSNSAMETYLYQLKNYVEYLFRFHLSKKYKLESIQDVAEFLSLPYDDKILKNQIDKRKLARKYHDYA
jgi:hypothetical protein